MKIFGTLLLVLGAHIAAWHVSPSVAQTAQEPYYPVVVPPESHDLIAIIDKINVRTPLSFQRVYSEVGNPNTLILASPGGNVHSALTIALQVHQHEMTTVIPEGAGCYSACSLIFFAGHRRFAFGELGVHQISSNHGDDLYSGQIALSDIIEILEDFDVPSELLIKMLRTPPEDMYVLSADEKIALGFLGAEADESNPQPHPGSPSPPSSDAPSFVVVEDVDLPGNDIPEADRREVTFDDCLDHCASIPSCRAVSYIVAKSWCWPKNAASAPTQVPGVSSAVPEFERDVLIATQGRGPTREIDTDFSGGDLTGGGIRNVDEAACESQCRNDPNCVGYSYVQARRWCWPKGIVDRRVYKDGVVSRQIR